MPAYERNPKHKTWLQPFDPDATQCPPWSHAQAQALLNASIPEPGGGRRFATANGMAFVARITRDDTWHGYPVPWAEVPESVRSRFLAMTSVTRRQIKLFFSSAALAAELEP